MCLIQYEFRVIKYKCQNSHLKRRRQIENFENLDIQEYLN